jgi:hypothetical protein
MGRGEHPWKNHHKKLNAEAIKKSTAEAQDNYILGVVIGILLFFYLLSKQKIKKIKAYGQLVLLGFTVTSFIPVAYQRHSL